MKKNWIFFDSHNHFFRQPFGAVPCNSMITLRLQVSSDEEVESIKVRLWGKEIEAINLPLKLIEKKIKLRTYEIKIKTPSNPGLLWYYFIVDKNGESYYYGNNNMLFGGIGQIQNSPPPAYQITVYKENAATPTWFKEAVVYQIFVDRFFNCCEAGSYLNPKKRSLLHGNWEDTPFYIRDKENKIKRWNFFGGNLQGIIKKLPYLKELGIKAIYLNPIFESPSNHKYDTSDYKKIDPMFGDNETFRQLCQKAREFNIFVILDGVFSHTGSDSIYFNKEGNYPDLGAYQSQKSPYYSWYKFKKYPTEYESWWGIDTLPNVNELDPSFLDFIIYDNESVIKYWMNLGVKGWRLDVADELPDDFIKEMHKVMKKVDSESVLIGEVWEDASNKISYGQLREYFLGEELDSVMNYPFRNIMLNFLLGQTDAQGTHKALMSLYENYPIHNFFSNLNLIGSHDVPRILTLLGDGTAEQQLTEEEKENVRLNFEQRSLGIKRLKLLALFQMTFPGTPCIYYGDEVGMEGYSDPYNRGPFPWGKEDQSLLNWHKKIISLRNEFDVFKNGKWFSIFAENDIYSFIRQTNDNIAICIFNRNPQKELLVQLDISTWCQENLADVLNQNQDVKIEKGKLKTLLLPLEGKVLMPQRKS